MVELKQLSVGDTNALGIIVNLPRGNIQLVIRNQIVLCDESINMEYLIKQYPLLCIIQCCHSEELETMLEEKIIKCSTQASNLGVCVGMKVLDVFTFL